MSIGYDGADTGYRLERKGLLGGSSDRIALREIELLRRRSHDLCRNNALAVTAQSNARNHWIGSGIKVKWNNKVVQKEWDKFCAAPNIDGWGDMTSTQHLWANGYFESGEIFSYMKLMDSPGRKVPLMLQTFATEQLDIRKFEGLDMRYGITFDANGKPLKYNFWKHYPNDYIAREMNTIVPLEARDVLHIFQRTRPGQWRGIPLLSGVILPMYEMDELADATFVRQKAATGVGWIVYTESGFQQPLIGDVENPYGRQSADDPEDSTRLERIKPGGIHYLRHGERFEFAKIEDIGANLAVLLQYQTRLCAAALEQTYEQLTGDLSNVNFSSIRAGTIEVRKKVATTQQLIFITQAMRPLTERFKELGSVYVSQAFADAKCKFVLPKEEWVDPLKDVQADLLEVRAGFATLEEKLGERGIEDVEAHMKQLMLEQGYDIVLESNPKHNILKTTTSDNKGGKNAQGK